MQLLVFVYFHRKSNSFPSCVEVIGPELHYQNIKVHRYSSSFCKEMWILYNPHTHTSLCTLIISRLLTITETTFMANDVQISGSLYCVRNNNQAKVCTHSIQIQVFQLCLIHSCWKPWVGNSHLFKDFTFWMNSWEKNESTFLQRCWNNTRSKAPIC